MTSANSSTQSSARSVVVRRRTTVTTAQQFTGSPSDPLPTGVCIGGDSCPSSRPSHSMAHIHLHKGEQPINLRPGDWLFPEADGTHYYPVSEEDFTRLYEEVDPTEARGEVKLEPDPDTDYDSAPDTLHLPAPKRSRK